MVGHARSHSLLVISAKASALLSRFCGRGTIEPPSDRDEDGDEAWHQHDRKGHLDEHLTSHQPADRPRAESDRDEKKRIPNLTEDARHEGTRSEERRAVKGGGRAHKHRG